MILAELARLSRERVEIAKARCSLEKLRGQAEAMEPMLGFPFERALQGSDIAFICEVKRASPSKGIIAKEFPYIHIATEYEQAGAAAISVLTEPTYFKGKNEYLQDIAQQVRLPVLRKDFTVDEYQIYEARTLGAAAILLIGALLDEEKMARYIRIAQRLGLSVLAEAHTAKEIQLALRAGARIIGVNNRNLKDFTVDLHTCERLRQLVPPDILFVAESGIQGAADIQRLRQSGVNAVLIGETLMRSSDKSAKLAELRGKKL